MAESVELTTLAVPKEFRRRLHEEFEGGNDFERLKSWAEKEYGYKNSISNEELLDALLDESDVRSVVAQELRDARR